MQKADRLEAIITENFGKLEAARAEKARRKEEERHREEERKAKSLPARSKRVAKETKGKLGEVGKAALKWKGPA